MLHLPPVDKPLLRNLSVCFTVRQVSFQSEGPEKRAAVEEKANLSLSELTLWSLMLGVLQNLKNLFRLSKLCR